MDDWATVANSLFDDPSDKRLATFDINRIGAFYESHPLFPEKTNVEFACVGPDGIAMRVYERGCGETPACGTGACAVGVAALLTTDADVRTTCSFREARCISFGKRTAASR